jgi:hypothetical protein
MFDKEKRAVVEEKKKEKRKKRRQHIYIAWNNNYVHLCYYFNIEKLAK